MTLFAYALYDKAAETFLEPFFAQSDAAAERGLKYQLTDQRSQLSMFPQDFVLYKLGAYDTDSGFLTPFDENKRLREIRDFFAVKDEGEASV